MRGFEIKITFVDEISEGLDKVRDFLIMNPDCRDEKHHACSGDGRDDLLEQPYPCPCICHTKEKTDE